MENRKALLLSELITLVNLLTKEFKDSFTNEMKKASIFISFDHSIILLSLDKKQGLSQKQLSSKLGKDPASMSRMIRVLVQKSLIQRKLQGKEKKIYLTPGSYDLLEKIRPLFNKCLLHLGRNIHDKELSILRELIKRLSS